MSDRVFVDTNILVCLFDRSEPEKRQLAARALRECEGRIVLSTQVLQEFYAVTTRKLSQPLEPADAEEACRRFAELPVIATDARLVLRAIGLSKRATISLWDALIVIAAQQSSCETLLTEDLQHDRLFGKTRIVNPFRAADEAHEPG